MKITLTPAEAENFFYNSLCNALGELRYYGLELDFNQNHYFAARKNLQEKKIETCFEDVLMEILRMGNPLTIADSEGDYNSTIYLKDVHLRVQNTPINHLMDAINQHDDATTGDVIIQSVFFNEVIFG